MGKPLRMADLILGGFLGENDNDNAKLPTMWNESYL